MNYDNELLFLQKAMEKCHVRTVICDPEKPLQDYMDPRFRDLTESPSQGVSLSDLAGEIRPATVYRLLDVYLCRYIFLRLPAEDEKVLLIGPYLHASLTAQDVLEQVERMGGSVSLSKKIENFYSSVPVFSEEHHLFALVNTFAEVLFGGEDAFSNVDLYFNRAAESPSISLWNESTDGETIDVAVMERRYDFENRLMEAVSQGNSQKAEQMMASFTSLVYEARTSDQLRNMKNYCIIMNTLLRKAAEKGGVHPVHLNRISSEFARRIEGLFALGAVSEFMLEMMHSYCRLVKRHSMKNYSPLVQKSMILIEGDLTADLSLHVMAEKNNVSPGYLSSLFKKETGQAYTAYVNGRRIASAKRLLKTTHLQIQTIAQHCGILDFHYFCRLFKTATGKTPTEYRALQVPDDENDR